MAEILTCLPWLASAGLVSVWRGDAPPIPLGLRRPMRPAWSPRGVIWNCLWPRRATPPLTEPAVGRELDPYVQLEFKKKQQKNNIQQKSVIVKRTLCSTAAAILYEKLVIFCLGRQRVKEKGKGEENQSKSKIEQMSAGRA